jgi:hypothetical protein
MEIFLRLLIYLVLGAGLVFCNALYIRSLIAAFRTDETIIMPVAVVGQEDKDGKLGTAIARMLAIRLKTLESEIAASQQWTAKGVQVFHPAAIRSDASPLEPLKIDAKVAGVDVGTVLPWVQNLLSRPHSVAFTIDFLDKDKALVTGDLRGLGQNERGVVSFQSSGAHDKIVDDMAHAVLQARLESRMRNGLDTIGVADFEQVVKSLGQVAVVNQAIARGEVAQTADLKVIVNGLGPVAVKLSAWWQLNYVAALVAQRAADSNAAIAFYQAVKARGSIPAPPSELVTLLKSGEIDKAIKTLSKQPLGFLDFTEDTSKEAGLARPRIEADIADAMAVYATVFSLQRPKATLKLIKDYQNSVWVATENAYYAPAAVQYTPDVTYHEVAHAFIENVGKLGYERQSGAIIESYADVCASWVSQRKSGQKANAADWTIGAGAVAALLGEGDPRQNHTALRSMKAPGPASKYDTQVDHYSKIPRQAEIHVAMGVPNKAFVETAIRIGTDKAIAIWIAAIPLLTPNATIPDLALATISAARATQGDVLAAKVNEGWAAVGLAETDARAITSSRAGQP